MPHIIIETSQNITLKQPEELLKAVNHNLWQTGQFGKETDIKSRLYTANHSLIGMTTSDDSFIAVSFYLMKGRDDAIKSVLTTAILNAIEHHITHIEKIPTHQSLQITINAVELSDSYVKKVI